MGSCWYPDRADFSLPTEGLEMKASRTRYSIVALAIGLAILSYVQRVAISQAAGPISHDLHLNKAQMGLVFGAFGLSYALFEIPIGLLGDKIGVRRVLLQIVLGWSFFTALTGAAWSFISLWVIRFPLRSRRGRLLSHPHPHA
jgi:ACS family glucarate transporter-like MFS transporter